MRNESFSWLGMLCSGLVICLLMAAGAAATTWDVAADFPGTTNPNGVWSYGYFPGQGSTFYLFWHQGTGYSGSPLWNNSNDDQPPIIWKNIGPPNWGVQTGELSLHPGPNNEHTTVRWTSPIAGTVNITGKFGAGDSAYENYYIAKDDSTIWQVLNTPADAAFSLIETVVPGTTIAFIVGGNYICGNTPLYATITSSAVVPLPGAVWLLGAGLLGLAVLRRQR